MKRLISPTNIPKSNVRLYVNHIFWCVFVCVYTKEDTQMCVIMR